MWVIFNRLRLWIAVARHNLKWSSGFSGSLCGLTSVQWFPCREKPMNDSWFLNRGPLSEATRPTLWELFTFNQLKHSGLYPIVFQCGASVAESCSALNQYWVLDMNSKTFQILHFNIELPVIVASNTKCRRHVILMYCQCHRQWYSITPTKKSESRNQQFQSISHLNNPTIFKMVVKKRTKRSSNEMKWIGL